MPSFDFITTKDFRESLEADDAEMRRAQESGAWKSVLVLSGSIVEALLVDYLLTTGSPGRSHRDPLKLDLAEVIDICLQEKALTERTANLCSVIRSYRNLIHPARIVRLAEPAPNKDSAMVAVALVEMISDEQARVRRAATGWTAEQLLSKIRRDGSALTILGHLLKEVNDHQKERLLLELIPSAYVQAGDPAFAFDDSMSGQQARLQKAFELIHDQASARVQQKCAMEFVRVVREEDGDYVAAYGAAFFRPKRLEHIPSPHREMIVEHLLGLVSSMHDMDSLERLNDLAKYLEPGNITTWLDPYIQTIIKGAKPVQTRARNQLIWEGMEVQEKSRKALEQRMNTWIQHYKRRDDQEAASKVEALWKEIEENFDIPF